MGSGGGGGGAAGAGGNSGGSNVSGNADNDIHLSPNHIQIPSLSPPRLNLNAGFVSSMTSMYSTIHPMTESYR